MELVGPFYTAFVLLQAIKVPMRRLRVHGKGRDGRGYPRQAAGKQRQARLRNHGAVTMLADQLSIDFPSHGRRELRAAIGHALEFTTWRSLTEQQRLTDAHAGRLMTAFVDRSQSSTAGLDRGSVGAPR